MGVSKAQSTLQNSIFKSSIDDILSSDEKEYLKKHSIIKMCNNPNWEPIEFAKKHDLNQMSGIAIDTLHLLENKLNIKFQNVPTDSWSQSQQFLKEKKCDILPAVNIHGYPNELIQCFMNIFNNAKDALKENNKQNDRYIFISQEVVDNYVIIKFKDNAGGIPENIINKVFEPYFTTKHQSQGTGLGLHMAYNLIVDG